MMYVYGTSTLTLSATSSYDCDRGLFARMSEDGALVGWYHIVRLGTSYSMLGSTIV
jgi:hypothetical protein